MVDYFSKWPEISKLDNLTAKNVILHMKSQMFRNRVSDEVTTDDGPQLVCAEFAQFMKHYDRVKNTAASPYYPQAGRHADTFVSESKIPMQSTA